MRHSLALRFIVLGAIATFAVFLWSFGVASPAHPLSRLRDSAAWVARAGRPSDHSSDGNGDGNYSRHHYSSDPKGHPLIEEDGDVNSSSKTINRNTTAELISTPASSNRSQAEITRRLVVATLADDDNSWIESELSDLLEPEGPLSTALYVVDDANAELHPPENKGHEAIVYLTYLIDHYERLPDVSIFMHGHGGAWHNNDLLNLSSSLMVRHLNLDKVVREGYMNLRCHWQPGCPAWLRPNEVEYDGNKQEQLLFAPAWRDLFPATPVPDVLAQPCCSQFAVSRDRILANARGRYVAMRDWLLGTDLPDADSGRVFEYCWQFLFHNSTTFCPDMRTCYCDGYGVCFETRKDWDDYFDVQTRHGDAMDAYWKWTERTEWFHRQQDRGGPDADLEPGEERVDELPPPDRGAELLAQAEPLEREMTWRKNAALALGADRGDRERILARLGQEVVLEQAQARKYREFRLREGLPVDEN
jgi:hypothetical protein